MIKQAIILAAGRGKRMLPLTSDTPKPLLMFHGRPIIDYIIEKLVIAGVNKIVVNGQYCADKLDVFLSDKRIQYPDVNFIFMREDTELDIAQGILNALPHFNDNPFYVLNGDIFWTQDPEIFERLAQDFEKHNTTVLAMCPNDNQISTVKRGEYQMFPDGRIIHTSTDLDMAYMGLHVTNSECMKNIPLAKDPKFLSVSRKWDELEADGNLRGVTFNGDLYHISIPSDLEIDIR